MSQDTHSLLAILSVIISLGTIIVAIWRGRDVIAKVALEAVGSIEGRSVVLTITGEKHGRIEEKLDKIEEKLDALATSVNGMAVRLAVIEHEK